MQNTQGSDEVVVDLAAALEASLLAARDAVAASSEEQAVEWAIRGQVTLDFEVVVEIDGDIDVEDIADDLVEQVRLSTSLPTSVEVQGQHAFVNYESSDAAVEDYEQV